MKSITKLLLVALACVTIQTASAQKQFVLKAPNGKLTVNVNVGKTVEYNVVHNGDVMIDYSPISMTLTDGQSFGKNPQLAGSKSLTVNRTIDAPVYKKKKVADNYNELSLKFRGDYNIVFRAYDDGMAYRFVSLLKRPFIVQDEQAIFNFANDGKAYIAYANKKKFDTFEDQFACSFENTYHDVNISQWNKKRLAFLPIVAEAVHGKKICITEADLLNYPGMFVSNDNETQTLRGVFATYPKDVIQGGHNMLQDVIQSREAFIAKCEGATSFPWRTVIVAEKDYELADSDMVYKLASPCQIEDTKWIKPGKVAWEWWNDWNLYGVDFKAGINNETYKYYIDFASENGIEYIILDEGWAVNLKADLMLVVPEIDLKGLVAYGKEKNVGLILWAGYYAINRDMENICKHYSEMGIKGFKVDFMDGDDQPMVDFHHRMAKMGAKYQLLIDFHGTYKPTGLQRTYPNVINFEGVYGLEQLKWNNFDMVQYDVIMPFVRMVAGPVDYTQGAMRNASKGNFRPVYNEAMSQGTRCHQLAEYVVFESPLNMLCDNPSNYKAEMECTDFIAKVPTVWDETIVLNGEIGKYVTIARRKGSEWYIGSLNNWDRRGLELDLSFLGKGSFSAEVFKDGINADKAAKDYKKEKIDVPADCKLSIALASGGGFVMRIYRAN